MPLPIQFPVLIIHLSDYKVNEKNTPVIIDTLNNVAYTDSLQFFDGQQEYIVTISDSLGNIGYYGWNNFIDCTAPEIEIISPYIENINPAIFRVKAKVTDNYSNPDKINVYAWIDSLEVELSINNETMQFESALLDSILEGTHNIIITAYDEAGNINTLTKEFLVSKETNIIFTGHYPESDSYILDNRPEIKLYFDFNSGKIKKQEKKNYSGRNKISSQKEKINENKNASLLCYLDNSLQDSFKIDWTDKLVSFYTKEDLYEGMHNVLIVWDNQETEWVFNIDNTSPVVNDILPPPGSILYEKPEFLRYNIFDAASGIEVDSVKIKCNSQVFTY